MICLFMIRYSVVFITLFPKIRVVIIQNQPLLNACLKIQYCLSPYFQNQLWHHSSMATIEGTAFDQENMALVTLAH